MFLKRIEAVGFKSFADKTVIEFKSGITGVVGPNGSGKSNISDAIRWVLGEQSVKNLRGGKMEDVIFAGTSKRKPLGYAEVTLVLDNKDNKLPIEYSEVSITRRLFRSGESEYYINKTSCRLKDIRELFMDTGVGKDGYSIIGQGRIDEILSSKSEDRRNIFEEAAGIVKYKTRKEEAEKKLEKTKENLIRINDIINELDSQIEPLKIQSEKAKTYLELSENLKDLEVNLFIREIDRLKEQISHIDNQKELLLKQLKYNEEVRDTLAGKYNQVKNEIEKMDNSIEEIQTSKYSTQNNIEKIEGEINLNTEKISILEKEMVRIDEESKDVDERIKILENQKEELSKKRIELENLLKSLNKQLEEKNTEFEELLKSISYKEKDIEEKKIDVIEVFNLIADKKSKINSINSFNQNIDKRIQQIQNEIDNLYVIKEKNNEELQETIQEISNVKEKLDELYENRKKESLLRREKEENLNQLVSQQNSLRENIQGKISNYNLLKDMKSEYEGFYKSVKNTLLAVKNNKTLGKGVKGVVAELIKVDRKYEKAIEVALGSALQNIVTETEEDAKRIIDYLKKHNLGRVTFLPMSSVKTKDLSEKDKKMIREKGLLGIASDLIQYDKIYSNIFSYLLGRVLIVNTIEDGIKIARSSNYSFKIVSLDGDVINPGGSITGGSYNTNTNYANILGRERQIKELEDEISNLKEKEKLIQNTLYSLKNDISQLDASMTSIEEDINNYKITLTKLENKEAQQRDENIKIKDLVKRYENEKEQLSNEKKESVDTIKNLEKELEDLKGQNDTTKVNIDNMIREFEGEKEKKDKIQKEITDIRIKMASYEQEIKSIDDNLRKLEEDVKRFLQDLDYKKQKKVEDNEEIENLRNRLQLLKDERNNLMEILTEQDIKLKEIKGDKNAYLQTFYKEQEKLNEMNKQINELQKSFNTLEVKETKYNTQLENITNKLWDDYELSYQMALKYKKEIESISKAQNEVKEIKNKIKELGSINIDSIEEYDRVKERYEFLSMQKDDLIKAKESLNKVIKDMEIKMKEQFIEQFEIIRNNFIDVFQKLFGGGKADVYLLDEADVLNTGIEIIAQPPGKKLQNISLLSGGEKALTAIALLFAILRTKPTPFCILDEIEAALDDANVYRFADYLKEFSKDTQFIVITHRKGTMESADALYGVTMEEEGVTKLVSVKLTDKFVEKAS